MIWQVTDCVRYRSYYQQIRGCMYIAWRVRITFDIIVKSRRCRASQRFSAKLRLGPQEPQHTEHLNSIA